MYVFFLGTSSTKYHCQSNKSHCRLPEENKNAPYHMPHYSSVLYLPDGIQLGSKPTSRWALPVRQVVLLFYLYRVAQSDPMGACAKIRQSSPPPPRMSESFETLVAQHRRYYESLLYMDCPKTVCRTRAGQIQTSSEP